MKRNHNVSEFVFSVKSLPLSSCIVYQSVVYLYRKFSPVSPPSLLSVIRSVSSFSSVTVTYNYSADLLPVSRTSAVQRNCRSVEESIVGVPGGFLDNELAQ